MILYDMIYGGHGVLGMVSSDGRIQLRLPARNGEAQILLVALFRRLTIIYSESVY